VVAAIEDYYANLVGKYDEDILRLQDQIELEKGMQRTDAAVELYSRASDLDYLSDLFIECVHAQRKSLRQKLVRMRGN